MYETHYDILLPYFRQKIFQVHYIDTDGMTLSMKTENVNKNLKKNRRYIRFQ